MKENEIVETIEKILKEGNIEKNRAVNYAILLHEFKGVKTDIERVDKLNGLLMMVRQDSMIY